MYIKLFCDLLSFIAKYERIGELSIWIVMFNVSNVGLSSESNRKMFLFPSTKAEGLTLETLDFTIRVGSTPTISIHISICISTLLTQHTTFILLSFMLLLYTILITLWEFDSSRARYFRQNFIQYRPKIN